jgi:branched-chain amino acid transport system ATP-binding protein
VVEHDMNFVMSVCDHIVVLDFGIQISQGSPREIRRDPLVIAAYLGESDEEAEEARAAELETAAGAER